MGTDIRIPGVWPSVYDEPSQSPLIPWKQKQKSNKQTNGKTKRKAPFPISCHRRRMESLLPVPHVVDLAAYSSPFYWLACLLLGVASTPPIKTLRRASPAPPPRAISEHVCCQIPLYPYKVFREYRQETPKKTVLVIATPAAIAVM
jgi:hypothetical protein